MHYCFLSRSEVQQVCKTKKPWRLFLGTTRKDTSFHSSDTLMSTALVKWNYFKWILRKGKWEEDCAVYFQMMDLQVNFIRGCINLGLEFKLIYNNQHTKCRLYQLTQCSFYCFFLVKLFSSCKTHQHQCHLSNKLTVVFTVFHDQNPIFEMYLLSWNR